MGYVLECSLEKQDCAKLYPTSPSGPYKLPFTNQSCVRDVRLEGNVGRCGFPGALCHVDDRKQDNCVGGLPYNLTVPSLCQGGVCGGGVGTPCTSNSNCNWGIQCNGTGTGALCGGFGAYTNSGELHTELDIGRDYCLSGQVFRNKDGYRQCQGGPTLVIIPPPITKVPKGFIAGISAVGTIALVAIISFILWWKRRQAFMLWWKRQQNRSRMSPVKTFDEDSSNIDEGKIDILSIPRPHIASEGFSAVPGAHNPSFSNFMIVPSRTVFPPEIQSDDNGNFSVRQTTALASLERRTVMACQGHDAALNTNSGFYGSAVPTAMNTTPSSKDLYVMAKAPLDPGIRQDAASNPNSGVYGSVIPTAINTKPDVEFNVSMLYDMANAPSDQGIRQDEASNTNSGVYGSVIPTAINTKPDVEFNASMLYDMAHVPSD